jgi:prolipoprotein diacylglyceryltransferase
MPDESLDERVRNLEISTAVIRHDVNNIRMATTGLEVKIDKLQTSIVRVGMSIVASIVMMLVGITAYFIVQKDEQLRQIQSRTEMTP